MQQLSGMDDILLHIERSGLPMQIGSLALYAPADASDGGPDHAQIRESIQRGVARAPVLRRLLKEVPLHLDRPYWVEDRSFDLDDHVQVIKLPQSSTWEDLCAVVARLFELPLDEGRPLWEVTLIENLDSVEGAPPGGFALFTKIHHSLLDGVAGTEIMKAFHDTDTDTHAEAQANIQADAMQGRSVAATDAPSTADVLLRAWTNELARAIGIAELAVKTLPTLIRSPVGGPDVAKQRAPTSRVPETRFNERPSKFRVFGGCLFDLAAVQSIRGAVEGATVNDVVLTICAGALRRYLAKAGELPSESVVAMAPVSIRSDEAAELGGNRVSMMSVALCTDVIDPIERLEAVGRTARVSKRSSSTGGSSVLVGLVDLIPSALGELAVRAYRALELSSLHDSFMSCIVTNVPGPSEPLYLAGSRMVANYGLGPIFDGIGLIHPVLSYCGGLTITFTSCKKMMPDPAFYTDCLRASFEELEAAARGTRCAPSNASSHDVAPRSEDIRA